MRLDSGPFSRADASSRDSKLRHVIVRATWPRLVCAFPLPRATTTQHHSFAVHGSFPFLCNFLIMSWKPLYMKNRL